MTVSLCTLSTCTLACSKQHCWLLACVVRENVWSKAKPDHQWRSSSFQESKKVRVSRDLWPWPWAHPGCRLIWRPSCATLVAIQSFAWEKKRFSCQHKSARITWPLTLTLTLTLSTPWMHVDMESIVCKFGSDPTICVGEEAICAKVYRRRMPRHCISSFLEWAKNGTAKWLLVLKLECSIFIWSGSIFKNIWFS